MSGGKYAARFSATYSVASDRPSLFHQNQETQIEWDWQENAAALARLQSSMRANARAFRVALEFCIQNRMGPIKDIESLDMEAIERLARFVGVSVNS